jgi:hypothetical protein
MQQKIGPASLAKELILGLSIYHITKSQIIG